MYQSNIRTSDLSLEQFKIAHMIIKVTQGHCNVDDAVR